MSSFAIQYQPVAPHQLAGHAALSPHYAPAGGGTKLDPKAMKQAMELIDMLTKDLEFMQKLMQLMQGGGQSAPDDVGGDADPFAMNQPSGCQSPDWNAGDEGSSGVPDEGYPQAGMPQDFDSPQVSTGTPAASDSPPTVSTQGTPSTVSSDMKAPQGMPAEQWQGCVEAGQKTGVDPYILAAQAKQESQFGTALAGSPSAGDGVMQVEPSTRQAYASKFEAKMGHPYDHGNVKDQIAMAGVILADKGGSATNMLQKYNGGDNWTPGTTDSYGRVILADQYAAKVIASADQMRAGG